MSFVFEWPRFSEQFHRDAIQMLNTALNKGNKPPVIADRIEVVELEMGTQPPELEIRDIGDLTTEQFRGIFRFTYAGDAHLVLRTKVQANPLNHKQPDIHLMGGSRGMLAAKQGLVVPMLLRLSQFKLNSYVVLVVSKQKGITLVFKTDPLQHVDIHSTFDSIAVIQKFIQREIEGQLRQMFREDLPGIIHRLSQQWVKAKVDAPYLSKTLRPPAPPPTPVSPSLSLASRELPPRRLARHPSSTTLRSSVPSSSYAPSSSSPRMADMASLPDESLDPLTFPDLEGFDPTYGLRSEGGTQRGSFGGLGKLFAKPRGLADLTEELGDTEESPEFDASAWDDSVSQAGPSRLSTPALSPDTQEYEMMPAVGGGIVSRPRVVQSHASTSPRHSTPSYCSVPSPLSRSMSTISATSPTVVRPALGLRMSSVTSNPYFPRVPSDLGSVSPRVLTASPLSNITPSSHSSPLSRSNLSKSFTSDAASRHANDMIPTPPPSDIAPSGDETIRKKVTRRPSLSSLTTDEFGFPSLQHIQEPGPSRIILRPALNNPVSKLSILSHSNHTLSPFTRSMEHFAVRSGPPRSTPSSRPAAQPERVPQKAKRKRMYRLGGKKSDEKRVPPTSPPFSDVGSDDMDRYFRFPDDLYSTRGR